MHWELDNPDADKQIARLKHDKRPIPDWLQKPELHDVEVHYWQAFCDLSGDRNASGFTPWTAMHTYAKAKGFSDIPVFERIIKSLDACRYDALEKQNQR